MRLREIPTPAAPITGPTCDLPFGSTVDNKITGVIGNLGWDATLTCEDCHIGPPDSKVTVTTSGHGTPTARYMLRDQDGNEAATAEPSTTSICYRCHTPDDTNSVFPEHLGTSSHTNDYTLFGISCLGCHGGGTWGGIHGVDAPVVDDDGGGSYDPNVFTYGTALDLMSNWTNWGRQRRHLLLAGRQHRAQQLHAAQLQGPGSATPRGNRPPSVIRTYRDTTLSFYRSGRTSG